MTSIPNPWREPVKEEAVSEPQKCFKCGRTAEPFHPTVTLFVIVNASGHFGYNVGSYLATLCEACWEKVFIPQRMSELPYDDTKVLEEMQIKYVLKEFGEETEKPTE